MTILLTMKRGRVTGMIVKRLRLALEAARKKAEQQSQQDKNAQQQSDTEASRLKYTEEAQKAYERPQTPLEKYTARQEELNKALKDGKILQTDYNTLMAAAKKDYEAIAEKAETVRREGVCGRSSGRQCSCQLCRRFRLNSGRWRSMPEQMRKSASSAGICGRRRVSSRYWRRRRNVASCLHRRNPSLAHKDETLEYKRQRRLHLATRLRVRSA
ncbi:hypothetical protein AB2F28_06855 [Escherichia coli]